MLIVLDCLINHNCHCTEICLYYCTTDYSDSVNDCLYQLSIDCRIAYLIVPIKAASNQMSNHPISQYVWDRTVDDDAYCTLYVLWPVIGYS